LIVTAVDGQPDRANLREVVAERGIQRILRQACLLRQAQELVEVEED
jgi:hypothetical protein